MGSQAYFPLGLGQLYPGLLHRERDWLSRALSQSFVLVVSRSRLGQGTPGQGKHSPYLIEPLFDQSHC